MGAILSNHCRFEIAMRSPKGVWIKLTTAFNWRQKYLMLTDSLMSKQLEGIAEMDETEFKYTAKGNRQLSTGKARKRLTEKAFKIKAVIGIDRSGHIVDQVVGHFTLAQLKANFLPKFSNDFVLCTDGHINYEYQGKQENIKHIV